MSYDLAYVWNLRNKTSKAKLTESRMAVAGRKEDEMGEGHQEVQTSNYETNK